LEKKIKKNNSLFFFLFYSTGFENEVKGSRVGGYIRKKLKKIKIENNFL